MKIRRFLLLALWLAIALAWIVGVALSRAEEGWEWPLRMGFGLLMLALFLVTEPLKGRIDEARRKRMGDGLTLALIGLVTVYLAAKVVQAAAGGALGVAVVLGLMTVGLGSAFTHYFGQRRRARRTLEILVGWCCQECRAKAAWTRELGREGCFGELAEIRPVKPDQVYGELDKSEVRAVTSERLLEIPGVGPAELAVIQRFLEVPLLPGIGMDVARQMHQQGLHSRADVAALSQEELTQFKGIGPVKARRLASALDQDP